MPTMPIRLLGNKYSIYFDGVNDYAFIAQNLGMNPSASNSGLTLQFWMKNQSLTGSGVTEWTIFHNVDATNNNYLKFSIVKVGAFFYHKITLKLNNGDVMEARATSTLATLAGGNGRWHLVTIKVGAASSGDNEIRLCINDNIDVALTDEGDGDITDLGSGWASSMSLGDGISIAGEQTLDGSDNWQTPDTAFWNGYITSLAWFVAILTDDMIKQIYYAQSEFNYLVATGFYTSSPVARLTTWNYWMEGDGDNMYFLNQENPTGVSGQRERLIMENGANYSSNTPRTLWHNPHGT